MISNTSQTSSESLGKHSTLKNKRSCLFTFELKPVNQISTEEIARIKRVNQFLDTKNLFIENPTKEIKRKKINFINNVQDEASEPKVELNVTKNKFLLRKLQNDTGKTEAEPQVKLPNSN